MMIVTRGGQRCRAAAVHRSDEGEEDHSEEVLSSKKLQAWRLREYAGCITLSQLQRVSSTCRSFACAAKTDADRVDGVLQKLESMSKNIQQLRICCAGVAEKLSKLADAKGVETDTLAFDLIRVAGSWRERANLHSRSAKSACAVAGNRSSRLRKQLKKK